MHALRARLHCTLHTKHNSTEHITGLRPFTKALYGASPLIWPFLGFRALRARLHGVLRTPNRFHSTQFFMGFRLIYHLPYKNAPGGNSIFWPSRTVGCHGFRHTTLLYLYRIQKLTPRCNVFILASIMIYSVLNYSTTVITLFYFENGSAVNRVTTCSWWHNFSAAQPNFINHSLLNAPRGALSKDIKFIPKESTQSQVRPLDSSRPLKKGEIFIFWP